MVEGVDIINNLTLYDLVSGWIPCLVLLLALPAWILHHNCYEHRCLRPARVLGDDSHRRCKRCHRASHPDYPH